jgi:hypothetical protein
MREVLALPAALNSVMREDVAAAAIGESADTIGRFPPFSKGFVGDTANDCFSYFVFYAPVAAGRPMPISAGAASARKRVARSGHAGA